MAARRPPGAVLLLGVLLLAVSILPGQANTRAAAAMPVSQAPAFDHIFVILEENQDYDRIVGNPQAPFINRLIAANFLQTDYHALGHGSLPDYLGLASASEQPEAGGVSTTMWTCTVTPGTRSTPTSRAHRPPRISCSSCRRTATTCTMIAGGRRTTFCRIS